MLEHLTEKELLKVLKEVHTLAESNHYVTSVDIVKQIEVLLRKYSSEKKLVGGSDPHSFKV